MNASDEELLARVREAIGSVLDPEFGVPVDELGLIYDLRVRGGAVAIGMTLTTRHCPAGEVIVSGVRAAVAAVPLVTQVDVELVWDPVWTPDMLSDRARAHLGWIDS